MVAVLHSAARGWLPLPSLRARRVVRRLCVRMTECVALGLDDAQPIQFGVIPYAARRSALCRQCKKWLRTKHEVRAARRAWEQAGHEWAEVPVFVEDAP
jgi:hypothetical protein